MPGVMALGRLVGRPWVVVGAAPVLREVVDGCITMVVGSHSSEPVKVVMAVRLVTALVFVEVGGGVDTVTGAENEALDEGVGVAICWLLENEGLVLLVETVGAAFEEVKVGIEGAAVEVVPFVTPGDVTELPGAVPLIVEDTGRGTETLSVCEIRLVPLPTAVEETPVPEGTVAGIVMEELPVPTGRVAGMVIEAPPVDEADCVRTGDRIDERMSPEAEELTVGRISMPELVTLEPGAVAVPFVGVGRTALVIPPTIPSRIPLFVLEGSVPLLGVGKISMPVVVAVEPFPAESVPLVGVGRTALVRSPTMPPKRPL